MGEAHRVIGSGRLEKLCTIVMMASQADSWLHRDHAKTVVVLALDEQDFGAGMMFQHMIDILLSCETNHDAN